MREIVITETPDDVTDAAADLIYEAQLHAVAERGVYRIALCGGSTPRALYAQLASEEWKTVMAWNDWEVFWGDERAVGPDHPDSNYRVARETLLSKVPIKDVWRMRGESGSLREAAEEYARTLKSRFGPGLPVFDTILLGMGADGHTASLFPGHSALESQALVESIEDERQPIPRRLTFTLPVINAARQVIFMVTGAEKAERVRDVLELNDLRYPPARIDPEEGTCWWLLDQAAASLLEAKDEG